MTIFRIFLNDTAKKKACKQNVKSTNITYNDSI